MDAVRTEILGTIPHREPFLFLETIKELRTGESVVALMKKDPGDPFYEGHFPLNPITPGVLIIEALAQASCYLFVKSVHPKPNSTYYLCSVKTKFFNQSGPVDIVELEVKAQKMISSGALFSVKAVSGGKVLASGELGFICKGPTG
ncbi:MAG: 3-hydroxyacyl-ACP dehydratase FabZ family protein [Candidatus Omnitrophota bacterium]